MNPILFLLLHELYQLIYQLPLRLYRAGKSFLKYLIQTNSHDMWVYCSGLGEVIALENVIAEYSTCFPQKKIIITCGTTIGREEAERRYIHHTIAASPEPWSLPVLFFLLHYRPETVCFFDMQLPPSYIVIAKIFGCKLLNINALLGHIDLSSTTEKLFYRTLLPQFDHLFTDAQAATEKLKLSTTRCHIMPATTISNTIEKQKVAQQNNTLITKTVLLVGSIRSEELPYYLTLFSTLKKEMPNIHLMLVPRTLWWHKKAIVEIQRHTQSYQTWAHQKSPDKKALLLDIIDAIKQTDITFISQMGILFDLYQHATIFYLGGTFNHIGGHNILEPATWHVPIIIGPCLAPANIMGQQLLNAGGAWQVTNQEELVTKTRILIKEKNEQEQLISRAQAWLNTQHHLSRMTIDSIMQKMQNR